MLGFEYDGENPYQGQIERITARIHQLRALKEAQEPGSHHEKHFQRQITELTEALLSWETTAPELVKLDDAIEYAQERVRRAVRNSDNASGGWLRIAGFSGVFGTGLLLLSLVWTPSYLLPLVGVVMVLVAVGALLVGVNSRRAAEAAVEEAREGLREIEQRRAILEPERVQLTVGE
jgi:hypothetical protein